MKPFILFLLTALVAVAAPDLSSIPVQGRRLPIKNASVKTVTDKTITFLCNDGLVQVAYDKLPPEFAEHYRPLAKPTAPVVVKTESKPTIIRTVKPVVKEKSAAELAKEAKARETTKVKLAYKAKTLEATIERYYKQTSFDGKPQVSEAEKKLAEVELADIKIKLAELDR